MAEAFRVAAGSAGDQKDRNPLAERFVVDLHPVVGTCEGPAGAVGEDLIGGNGGRATQHGQG